MANKEKLYSYDEFVCLLFLYAAYSDLEFSEEERQFIIEEVGEGTLKNMVNIFDRLGEYEKLEIILAHKHLYFNTSNKKEQLLKMLSKYFHIDGEFSKPERTLYRFFEKLL